MSVYLSLSVIFLKVIVPHFIHLFRILWLQNILQYSPEKEKYCSEMLAVILYALWNKGTKVVSGAVAF